MPHKEFCTGCGESMSRVYERGPAEQGQKFVPLGWKCSLCKRVIVAPNNKKTLVAPTTV